MPRSKTGAGPGHIKSRYGQNGLFSLFSALVQDRDTYKVGMEQMGYFLLFSAPVQGRDRTGARKK